LLAENTLMVPTIMLLWFLTYNIMCMSLYPLMGRIVNFIDRYSGTIGLLIACLVWSFIAVLPMLIDQSKVHLFFAGAKWFDALTWEETHTFRNVNRTDDIITDHPQMYDHQFIPDGAVWRSKLGTAIGTPGATGKRDFLIHYRDGPQYRLPWFQNESSVSWPIAFMLYFMCGMATVNIMHNLEEWYKSCDTTEAESESSSTKKAETKNAKGVADERTPLNIDIESGRPVVEDKTPRTTRLLSRIRAAWTSGFKTVLSHEGRGVLADLCVLSIVVPSFVQPLDYRMYRDNYFPRANGFGDVSNWSKAYTPIYCLFLFGSASQGGAGVFAGLFGSEVLVALGDIALAMYASQATVARFCAVRWFLRGPNGENFCKDIEDYFREMPGQLTDYINAAGEDLSKSEQNYLQAAKNQCLDTTGDLLTVYLIILFIVSNVITYNVEPFLDEKFRSTVNFVRTTDGWEVLGLIYETFSSGVSAAASCLRLRRAGASEDLPAHGPEQEDPSLRSKAESVRRGMLGWIDRRRDRGSREGASGPSREHELAGGERESLLKPQHESAC
jgi:hypothetical protein